MKKIIKILALILFVGTVTLTQQGCFGSFGGQSITFSDCSIEMNAKDDKGNDRLVYHFTAEVSGMKEHGIQMILSVESPKGTPYTYVDEEGDEIIVREKKDFKNKNQTDSFSLKNKIVGIQNSKLHLKEGETTFYVRLTAYDEITHAEIGSSPYMAVTMTGKEPEPSATGSTKTNNNASNNKSSNNTSKSQSSSGPSVSFSKCNLEHNVTHNNRKMLKCNYTANVIGVKGHDVQFIMTIECPKGTLLYGKNGNALESKTQALDATYDNSKFDSWVGIYNDNLNPLPGKNTYYVRITAKDLTTGKTLGKSDYVTYTQTGSSNSNKNNNSSQASYSPSTSLHKGYYYIHIAIDPHYCIDLKDGIVNNGQNIQLRRSDGSGGQQWYLEPNNDGSYYIRSRLNNDYVLDAKGGIAADGTNLILYRFNGKANQRWYFEQCSQDLYYIHSAMNDNYVIDLEQANIQNGANIEIYHSKHNNAQRWKINK